MSTSPEPDSPTPTRSLPTVARLVAGAAVLVAGLVHVQLYLAGYRNIPDVGRSFALTGVVSVMVAGALAVRHEVVVRLAARRWRLARWEGSP